MTITTKVLARPQYTPGFLAGSFGISLGQAKSILADVGNDQLKAAEALGFSSVLIANLSFLAVAVVH